MSRSCQTGPGFACREQKCLSGAGDHALNRFEIAQSALKRGDHPMGAVLTPSKSSWGILARNRPEGDFAGLILFQAADAPSGLTTSGGSHG